MDIGLDTVFYSRINVMIQRICVRSFLICELSFCHILTLQEALRNTKIVIAVNSLMLQWLILKEGLKSVKKSAKTGTGATHLSITLPYATSKKLAAHALEQ